LVDKGTGLRLLIDPEMDRQTDHAQKKQQHRKALHDHLVANH
jgi:hypothetical protein